MDLSINIYQQSNDVLVQVHNGYDSVEYTFETMRDALEALPNLDEIILD